jgi:hypothetical protein
VPRGANNQSVSNKLKADYNREIKGQSVN